MINTVFICFKEIGNIAERNKIEYIFFFFDNLYEVARVSAIGGMELKESTLESIKILKEISINASKQAVPKPSIVKIVNKFCFSTNTF